MREAKGDVELARDSTLDRAVDEPELTVQSAWCAFSEVWRCRVAGVLLVHHHAGSKSTQSFYSSSPRSASICCKTYVSHCSFTGRPFFLWFELGAASPVSTLEARSSRRD